MKLTGSDVVTEWYVKYEGTNVNFTKMQETVANVAAARSPSPWAARRCCHCNLGDNSSTNIDMTASPLARSLTETGLHREAGLTLALSAEVKLKVQ